MNQVKDISESDIHKMHKENALDKEECERVTRSSSLGESYKPDSDSPAAFRKAFYKEVLYRDPKTDGFIVRMPHGTVIHQAERNHYYRGECYEYESSIPSLQRDINKIDDPLQKECCRIVAYMRIAEFDHFIHRLDRVKSWEERGLTVLTDALAQHYGLKTDWLDITNDFDTALFFANCKFDEDNGWSPLSNADTEQKRKTQYGVLFRSTSERINIENMSRCFNGKEGMILPIGYQPFMRCHSQYGYGFYDSNAVSLQQAGIFERLRFRHSEKLANWIYELMDCGNKIYPREGLDDYQDVINSIKSAVCFSEFAFEKALIMTNMEGKEQDIRKALSKYKDNGYPISIQRNYHPYVISRQRLRRTNRMDQNFSIEKAYGIRLTTRYVYESNK